MFKFNLLMIKRQILFQKAPISEHILRFTLSQTWTKLMSERCYLRKANFMFS